MKFRGGFVCKTHPACNETWSAQNEVTSTAKGKKIRIHLVSGRESKYGEVKGQMAKKSQLLTSQAPKIDSLIEFCD